MGSLYFEKGEELGGLLNLNAHCSFKWPIHNYNEWLKKQVMKNKAIDIRLNTEATQEMLHLGNYDEIFAAIGADPVKPNIPGIDSANVMYAADVYGHEEKVGKNVAIIGGGDVGVETGFHLAYQGRNIFVIEMQDQLMKDATPIHYVARYVDEWNKLENFNYACNATCTEITSDGVIYHDSEGDHTVEADTVIYSVGMRSKEKEALDLYWRGKEIHLIGDCREVGSVQTCSRDAFRAVNSL